MTNDLAPSEWPLACCQYPIQGCGEGVSVTLIPQMTHHRIELCAVPTAGECICDAHLAKKRRSEVAPAVKGVGNVCSLDTLQVPSDH